MKLSIFTTITHPLQRGDNSADALKCYDELADEVVIVDGTPLTPGTLRGEQFSMVDSPRKYVLSHWPKEFDWKFIGEQFQRGYEACTGDWVIHADIDFIFHENDFKRIREVLQANSNEPALSFYKWQFILPDRYNLKSRLVIAVNKKLCGDKIKFNSGRDLCQPSLQGIELSPERVKESGIAFYNYEKLKKTKEQIAEDQGRMERAYKRHFGRFQMRTNGSNTNAYKQWVKAQQGKFAKPQAHIELKDHPKYIYKTIRKLKPEQWGYSGHGFLEENDYIRSKK